MAFRPLLLIALILVGPGRKLFEASSFLGGGGVLGDESEMIMTRIMRGENSLKSLSRARLTNSMAYAPRGQPLPADLRAQAEELLGEDLSDVRLIVTNAARRIGARAFTVGSEIHFAPGALDLNTPAGVRLLGHELAHVVQQRKGVARNTWGYGAQVVSDPRLEADADRCGRALQRMQQDSTPPLYQRVMRTMEILGHPKVEAKFLISYGGAHVEKVLLKKTVKEDLGFLEYLNGDFQRERNMKQQIDKPVQQTLGQQAQQTIKDIATKAVYNKNTASNEKPGETDFGKYATATVGAGLAKGILGQIPLIGDTLGGMVADKIKGMLKGNMWTEKQVATNLRLAIDLLNKSYGEIKNGREPTLHLESDQDSDILIRKNAMRDGPVHKFYRSVRDVVSWSTAAAWAVAKDSINIDQVQDSVIRDMLSKSVKSDEGATEDLCVQSSITSYALYVWSIHHNLNE